MKENWAAVLIKFLSAMLESHKIFVMMSSIAIDWA